MTQAAIVSGSVPGSASTLATFVTSIAIWFQVSFAGLQDCRAPETTRLLSAERLGHGVGRTLLDALPGGQAALQQQRRHHQPGDHDRKRYAHRARQCMDEGVVRVSDAPL